MFGEGANVVDDDRREVGPVFLEFTKVNKGQVAGATWKV